MPWKAFAYNQNDSLNISLVHFLISSALSGKSAVPKTLGQILPPLGRHFTTLDTFLSSNNVTSIIFLLLFLSGKNIDHKRKQMTCASSNPLVKVVIIFTYVHIRLKYLLLQWQLVINLNWMEDKLILFHNRMSHFHISGKSLCSTKIPKEGFYKICKEKFIKLLFQNEGTIILHTA